MPRGKTGKKVAKKVVIEEPAPAEVEDGPSNDEILMMKVKELQALARKRGLDTKGTKGVLLKRLGVEVAAKPTAKGDDISQMRVPELKIALSEAGLSTAGVKVKLVARLRKHRANDTAATPAKRAGRPKGPAVAKPPAGGMTKDEARKFMDALIEIGMMKPFPRDNPQHTAEWALYLAFSMATGDEAAVAKLSQDVSPPEPVNVPSDEHKVEEAPPEEPDDASEVDVETIDYRKMRVGELRTHANERGLSDRGSKKDLIARLTAPPAQETEGASEEHAEADEEMETLKIHEHQDHPGIYLDGTYQYDKHDGAWTVIGLFDEDGSGSPVPLNATHVAYLKEAKIRYHPDAVEPVEEESDEDGGDEDEDDMEGDDDWKRMMKEVEEGDEDSDDEEVEEVDDNGEGNDVLDEASDDINETVDPVVVTEADYRRFTEVVSGGQASATNIPDVVMKTGLDEDVVMEIALNLADYAAKYPAVGVKKKRSGGKKGKRAVK